MSIDCFTTEKGGKQTLVHDLNFAKPTYENVHAIQFKNPSQALQAILRETGPLPSDEDRKARKTQEAGPGKKKKAFDVEKMAEAIQKLGEDDLMHIIQLIHDHKSDDTYIINNVDGKSVPYRPAFTVLSPLSLLLADNLDVVASRRILGGFIHHTRWPRQDALGLPGG